MSDQVNNHNSMTTNLLSDIVEYQCKENLNLYDSPQCNQLATQGATGRHLRLRQQDLTRDTPQTAISVQLCEDDYPGWLATTDLDKIEPASEPYHSQVVSPEEINQRLPAVIAFTHEAMKKNNQYLWGGTVGPNYDCSGLMQTAFAAHGIWLPRDAYQQEAFTQPLAQGIDSDAETGKLRCSNPTGSGPIQQKFRKIVLSYLQPGDLVFFGLNNTATHVGLYLGEGLYIHSSGTHQGRNGIGIDVLSEQGDQVSLAYCLQLRGAGRVVASYQGHLLPDGLGTSNASSITGSHFG